MTEEERELRRKLRRANLNLWQRTSNDLTFLFICLNSIYLCVVFYRYFDWGFIGIPFVLYFSYIFNAAITYYLLRKVKLIGLISLSALFSSSVYSVATSSMVNLSRADICSALSFFICFLITCKCDATFD